MTKPVPVPPPGFDELSADEQLDYVQALWDRVAARPLQFPEIAVGVRRGLMSRFPYGVYFKPTTQRIVILAVLHLHRHPDAWKLRAKGRSR